MSELTENHITAALTFKVPHKVGWSVQRGDHSWAGGELCRLIDCLAQEGRGQSLILSLSLIFELTENNGTAKLLSN